MKIASAIGPLPAARTRTQETGRSRLAGGLSPADAVAMRPVNRDSSRFLDGAFAKRQLRDEQAGRLRKPLEKKEDGK